MQQEDRNAAVSESADERRARLLDELEQIEHEERAEQEHQAARGRQDAEEDRHQEAEQQTAALRPDQKAVRDEIERRGHEALDRDWPPAWSPHKPGSQHPNELVGMVMRIDPRVGPSKTFGTYSAVVELKATDSREWTIWCNEGGALHAQLVRQRIQPGEVIAVRYRGLKDSEAHPGQRYQDYRLVRVEEDDGEPQQVDYDALERSKEGPAALPPAKEEAPDDDIPF
jgi:YD repeat-containing protein